MAQVQILFLGSGTSTGVPMIGCACRTCTSTDGKDNRTRSSILLRWSGGETQRQVLVDASTDLRAQSLRFGLNRLDAVLFTHTHADHVHGIDELRSFNFIQKAEIPCYGSPETMLSLRTRFDYIFKGVPYEGGGIPQLSLHSVEEDFDLFGMKVSVLPVKHGSVDVYGYRFGPVAYITDCNFIPPQTMEKIRGVSLLVVGAVQLRAHSTHFSLYEAIDVIRAAGAGRGYITHMNHDIMHAEVSAQLPENIFLAYDGLSETVVG